ncbi:hypothetical protein [Xanthomonas theicola]|uniref:hypothetical protein n=1 Tax=Xanthomonas theicola TaxID=56464 RepID=UPI000FF8A533|nr:hypothetical protein [Xanthomonas theicola]QNH25510.1 hypothetical protein G4Q83_13170 [Xanthomonas theicola]
MGDEQAQVQWDKGWWDLGDLETDRPAWEVVERLLPAGWERAARDCRAMVRRHGSISSASMLLRVLLIRS